HVLGIKVMAPGCRQIKIEPHLGNLKWVEGSFPTPLGVVRVRHTRLENGEVKTEVEAPAGVEVI
ncbi:MAG TPA: alpha-L-rhamnosidase C-terminal domain-containing protein, partial [Flavilitoribacter sp.]|nr:alpha-L-rhamnosidase C-terminal domain-containing protein [Flavilitoribacter sp.]